MARGPAGLTAYHQGPALTGPHASNEPVKYATFAEPAALALLRGPRYENVPSSARRYTATMTAVPVQVITH